MKKVFNGIIYHENCIDGISAAWLLMEHLKRNKVNKEDIYCLSAQYSKTTYTDLSKFTDATKTYDEVHIYIVDFSFDGVILDKLCSICTSVVVLDHHVSALNKLNKYYQENKKPDNLTLHLNMERSGVGIVDEVYFGGSQPYHLLKYVEDYDIWTHALPESKAVHTWIHSKRPSVRNFTEIVESFQKDPSIGIGLGNAVLAFQDSQINAILRNGPVNTVNIKGHDTPVYPAPSSLFSRLGEEVYSKSKGIVLMYMHVPKQGITVFALRSHASTPVNDFAESMGGGGHPLACGFTLPMWSDKAKELIGVK